MPRPIGIIAALLLLAVSPTVWAGKKRGRGGVVQVVPMTFAGSGCCQTLRVTPGGVGRLLVDTRDGCEAPGHQWRVMLAAPGKKLIRTNVGGGSCAGGDGTRDTNDDWSGVTRLRAKAPNPYRVTVCYEGGSGTFPVTMDVRLQYTGPTLSVEGPLLCEVCPTQPVTTTLPPTTTTTSEPVVCTTTSTLQPCGGYVGSAVISVAGSGPQTLIDPVPSTGTLHLTISGTICHGGSFVCEHTYDYEFWLNDPSMTPSHVTNILINGAHRIPDGAPTSPDANNTYVVSVPVVAGDAVTAVDVDSVYNDNTGALGVTMNLVCSP